MRGVSVTRSVPGVSCCKPQHLSGDLLPGGGAREATEAGEASTSPSPRVVTDIWIILQLVLLAGEVLKVLTVRREAVLPGDGVGLEQGLARGKARVSAAPCRLLAPRGPGDCPQCPRGLSVGGAPHGRGQVSVAVRYL